MKISKILQTLFLAASVATLAACGGGSTTVPTPVATSNASIALNPTTGPAFLQALNGQSFSFPGGVPELGTAGPTTVSFSGGNFTITSGGQTATGPMTFGSCIFKPSASSLLSIPAGTTITINPCSLEIATNGKTANGVSTNTTVTLKFPSGVSINLVAQVAVFADGTVTVYGIVVGKATVAAPTGATGGN